MLIATIKDFFLEILFPRFCLGCGKEKTYLCDDCFSLIPLSEMPIKTDHLEKLYFATDYHHFLVKKIIHLFKYPPFVRDLKFVLVFIILNYFKNLKNPPRFLFNPEKYLLIPVPLFKKRLNWRGFNQSEVLAQELSRALNIPCQAKVLKKIKNTKPQTELSPLERKENIKNAFFLGEPSIVEGKKIILIDDIYTTGATMNECASLFKKNGVRSVEGIVIAKG